MSASKKGKPAAMSGDVAKLADAVRRMNARTAAADDLQRYADERDARLVWRAFQDLREAGEPLPPVLLAIFDRWAAGLADATTPTAMLQALELAGNVKRHRRRHAVATHERRFIVVSEVEELCARDVGPTEAIRRVAARHGMTVPQVKALYYRRK